MRKILVLTLVAVMLVIMLTVPVYSADERVVYDKAGLYTEEQISAIEKSAKKHFADLDGSVYIITATDKGSIQTWDDIERVCGELDNNAVALVIFDNYAKNYELYARGEFNRKISNGEVDDILDDNAVSNSIKVSADYEKAALRFIELSAKACETQVVLAIVIGVIFGLVAAGITAAGIIYSYKKKLRSEKYPLSRYARLELTDSADHFAGTFITKKYINRNNGRSGGSFGGGGGSRGGR